MDFVQIKHRVTRSGGMEVYPDFQVLRSRDIMVRGKAFRAIWDPDKGLWSTDEYTVRRLVDERLAQYATELAGSVGANNITVRYLGDFSSRSWAEFRSWVSHISDNAEELDSKLTFANSSVRKEDYVTKRLPYALQEGPTPAYEELVSTLYAPAEREKFEWAIGSVLAGEAKHIQKFIVFYGQAGTGKSTIIGLIQRLFAGYYTTFEAKALVSSSNAFSTEAFKDNPLVAIQHDGDLSRIEDNSKLNSITAHEEMLINEKYKPGYTSRINAFLFMGTNRPVRITDAQSGLIRRLIDVTPTGDKVPPGRYHVLIDQMNGELGAIAHHCLEVYRSLGKNYYNGYKPTGMMFRTDTFYNYVQDTYLDFVEEDGVSLQRAYDMYKAFCDASLIDKKLPRHVFREELKHYFESFSERARINGAQVRGWYQGFKRELFEAPQLQKEPEKAYALTLDATSSKLDDILANQPAQLATDEGIPHQAWDKVTTRLADIDTSMVHYVRPPLNHIVIDFDLRNESGDKDLSVNVAAASQWPPTYAEVSKGGSGIHLHYIYDGDPEELSAEYSSGIEIKVFKGKSALRRKLTICNDRGIAHISTGLPIKEQTTMIDHKRVASERGLRELILRNLRKEIHPGTKPSVEFIQKILDDAYADGLQYDLTDMRNKVLTFALNSTNHSAYCVGQVNKMKFRSSEVSEEDERVSGDSGEPPVVYFDVEVFPNLFLVNWKIEDQPTVNRMINPSPNEIEQLVEYRLVGFNNRKYDNHILYGRLLGYDNQELYRLSKRLVTDGLREGFADAYSLSYADVYDYAATKTSLKRWEVTLGLPHRELGLDWDSPVPDDLIPMVSAYCDNDVIATEAVAKHLSADFAARKILAEVSGLTVNHTTKAHTTKILFGNDPQPNTQFVYTDLSERFPGYKYEFGKSTYRGVETGEGGYVYAEPGVYHDVALLDVASMHPTSIELLNLFGPYTERFSELKKARLAIKRHNFEEASTYLNGALRPYLNDEYADSLAYALKIVINTVYGLTIARYPNKFVDPRNKDNIVAKRGALFMVDLQNFVQEAGYTVAHIKTDSIKIPNATPEIINKVLEFGKTYGYEFEHETTYHSMALVNDAVYIARDASGWHATGAQFQHPYVFKTLFSGEPIEFDDMCETRTVTTSMYLRDANGVDTFVGRVGRFAPIPEELGGRELLREKEGKFYAVGGSKGYHWMEAEQVQALGLEGSVDRQYFEDLVSAARDSISRFTDFEEFVRKE